MLCLLLCYRNLCKFCVYWLDGILYSLIIVRVKILWNHELSSFRDKMWITILNCTVGQNFKVKSFMIIQTPPSNTVGRLIFKDIKF